MQTLYGMPVFVNNLIGKKPRFTLAANVPVTQKFRDDFNEWARVFFGEDEQVIIADGNIFMNGRVHAKLLVATHQANTEQS